MGEEIKILGDGSIVKLNDDGSVTIIGNVSKKNIPSGENHESNIVIWILAFLLVIAIMIIVSLCVSLGEYQGKASEAVQRNAELQNRLKKSEGEIEVLNTKNSQLQYKVSELQADLNSMKLKALPIQIKDVLIGNVDVNGRIETNYGMRILSKNSMFIAPRITYYASSIQNVKIDVKIYDPKGSLSRSQDNAISNYSYSSTIRTRTGNNSIDIEGWGASQKGHWDAGKYRIELWCNGLLAYSKEFEIYLI